MENNQMPGGLLVGNSHSDGGIKIKTPEGQIEAEGGEVIINKRILASDEKYVCEGTPKEMTSKINEMEGGVSWSAGGSCRIVKKSEDGSVIGEEEINRAPEGIVVQYISDGKLHYISADTNDQAELIHDALNDFKEGFITSDELTNTLESYQSDEAVYDIEPNDIETIDGEKYIYIPFYEGWVPFFNKEAVDIDTKAGDGKNIVRDEVTFERIGNGWNFHYKDSFGTEAIGVIRKNTQTGELDYIIEDTQGSFNADADRETSNKVYKALEKELAGYSERFGNTGVKRASFGILLNRLFGQKSEVDISDVKDNLYLLQTELENIRTEYRFGGLSSKEYSDEKKEIIGRYQKHIDQAQKLGIPIRSNILYTSSYIAEKGKRITKPVSDNAPVKEEVLPGQFRIYSKTNREYDEWIGSEQEINEYINEVAGGDFPANATIDEKLDSLNLARQARQEDEMARMGKSIIRTQDVAKRPSPSVSATIYPAGYRMEGNDGNMWEIAVASNGVRRWARVKSEDGTKLNATKLEPETKLYVDVIETNNRNDERSAVLCYKFHKDGKHIADVDFDIDFDVEEEEEEENVWDYRTESHSTMPIGMREYFFADFFTPRNYFNTEGGEITLSQEDIERVNSEFGAIFKSKIEGTLIEDLEAIFLTDEEFNKIITPKAANGLNVVSSCGCNHAADGKEVIEENPKIRIRSNYDERDPNAGEETYSVNYLFITPEGQQIEIEGELAPSERRGGLLKFEADWFSEQADEDYYEENSEKIEEQILAKFNDSGASAADGMEIEPYLQEELKAAGFDPSKYTANQADLILQPAIAPENYFMDGEISHAKAKVYWKQKLANAGLSPADIAKAVRAFAADGVEITEIDKQIDEIEAEKDKIKNELLELSMSGYSDKKRNEIEAKFGPLNDRINALLKIKYPNFKSGRAADGTEIGNLRAYVKNFIKEHPEHKSDAIDLYELAVDEIHEGGDPNHEAELCYSSLNQLLKNPKAADGKNLKTINRKTKEHWFSEAGELGDAPKGTAYNMIMKAMAKRFGAENMELVGKDKEHYIYELEGNPTMIKETTTMLQEERGLDVETYGRKTRVHLPKLMMDAQMAGLRFPLITPYGNGGGIKTDFSELENTELRNVLISFWNDFFNNIGNYLSIEKENYILSNIDNVFVIVRNEDKGNFSDVEKQSIDRFLSPYFDSNKKLLFADFFNNYEIKDNKIIIYIKDMYANGGGVGFDWNKAMKIANKLKVIKDRLADARTKGDSELVKKLEEEHEYYGSQLDAMDAMRTNKMANGGGVGKAANGTEIQKWYNYAHLRIAREFGDNFVNDRNVEEKMMAFANEKYNPNISNTENYQKLLDFIGHTQQAKYGRSFRPYKKSYGSGFSGRTNREEYLGNGVWGDDEGNRWDKNGKTISGYGKSGKTKEEEYEEKYGKKTVAPANTEDDKIAKANLIASRIAAKKGQPVTEKLVQWVLKQMAEGKFAADGKNLGRRFSRTFTYGDWDVEYEMDGDIPVIISVKNKITGNITDSLQDEGFQDFEIYAVEEAALQDNYQREIETAEYNKPDIAADGTEIKALLEQIASDFSSFRPGGQRGNVIVDKGSVSKEFRDLGNWETDFENPDYEEGDEEDNDYEIWKDEDLYEKEFKDWASQYPWFKKVDLEVTTGEKNWAYFYITLKDKAKDGTEINSDWGKIIEFVKENSSWFDVERADDREILLATRDSGDTGNETFGVQDWNEAKRIFRLVSQTFPGKVSGNLEDVDEWVHLTITPKAEHGKEISNESLEGKTVRLINMPDDPRPVPAGTLGKIKGVDDAGHILVRWENGSGLSLIPGVDEYEILDIAAKGKAISKFVVGDKVYVSSEAVRQGGSKYIHSVKDVTGEITKDYGDDFYEVHKIDSKGNVKKGMGNMLGYIKSKDLRPFTLAAKATPIAKAEPLVKLTYPGFSVSPPVFVPDEMMGTFKSEAHYEVAIDNSAYNFKTKEEADGFYNKIKDFTNLKQLLPVEAQYKLDKLLALNNDPNVMKMVKGKYTAPPITTPVYPTVTKGNYNKHLELSDFSIVEPGTYFKFRHFNFGSPRTAEFVFDSVTVGGLLGWLNFGKEGWVFGDYITYVTTTHRTNPEQSQRRGGISIGSGAETLYPIEIIPPPNNFELPNALMSDGGGIGDEYEIILYSPWGDENHSYTKSTLEEAVESAKGDKKLFERTDEYYVIMHNGEIVDSSKENFRKWFGLDKAADGKHLPKSTLLNILKDYESYVLTEYYKNKVNITSGTRHDSSINKAVSDFSGTVYGDSISKWPVHENNVTDLHIKKLFTGIRNRARQGMIDTDSDYLLDDTVRGLDYFTKKIVANHPESADYLKKFTNAANEYKKQYETAEHGKDFDQADNSSYYIVRMWDTDEDKMKGITPEESKYETRSEAVRSANHSYYEENFGIVEVEDESGNRIMTLDAYAKDGKQVDQADYLTNAILSVLDLQNYMAAHGNTITIHGSKYTYYSHTQYNIRVTGDRGAIYNIIPYTASSSADQLEGASFFALIRQKRPSENFALTKDGTIYDIADNGTEIKH